MAVSENLLGFLLRFGFLHIIFPFAYRFIVVFTELFGIQIIIGGAVVNACQVLNSVIPPVVLRMSKGSPELAASAV